MPDTRWKKQERTVAALLGGVRLPNSGRGQPDVRAPGLAGQVRTMKALPLWLLGAVEQAGRDAEAGELPVVVLCAVTQGKRTRRLLVMDLDALMTWPGPAGSGATAEVPE
jgi:hypothetical protein